MDLLKFETENSLLNPAASAHSTQDPVSEDESMNIIILNTFSIMPELIRLDDEREDHIVHTSKNIPKQPRKENCNYSVIPKILKPSRQKSDYYQCKFCSEPFSMLRYLRKHFTNHNKELPNKCQEYYTASIANGHMSALNKFCTKNVNTQGTKQISNDEEGNDDEVQILRINTKFSAGLPDLFVNTGSKIIENLEESFFTEICPDDQQMDNQQNIVNDQFGFQNSLQDNDHPRLIDTELASRVSNGQEILNIATRCNGETTIVNDNCRDQTQINGEDNYTESLNVEMVGETPVLDTQAERRTSHTTTSVEHPSVGYATRSKSLPDWQQRNSSIQKWKQASKRNSKEKCFKCPTCQHTFCNYYYLNKHKGSCFHGKSYTLKYRKKNTKDAKNEVRVSKKHNSGQHATRARNAWKPKITDKGEVSTTKFGQLRLLKKPKIIPPNPNIDKCHICNCEFASLKLLQNHALAAHNLQKDSQNTAGLKKDKGSPNLQQQQKLRKEKSTNDDCHICKQAFPKQLHLRRHKFSAHGLSPLECEICSKRYSTIRSLHRHKLAVHEKFRYKCDLCQKEYAQLSYMKEHKKVAHKGYRYKCDLCQKEYTQLLSLKEHKRVGHEGHCYKCEFCLKEFKKIRSLKEHKRSVHHGLRYECDLCPKDFSYSKSLTRHKSRAHRGSK